MKQRKKNAPGGLSRRLRFPSEEERLPWLAPLLDAYAIIDTGVAIAVRNEEKRRKTRLACGKGCGGCCMHQRDIPLYPHELVGIYWYASERLSPDERRNMRERLVAHRRGAPCPFLIEGSCSIHPLRPVGCRQFNVFAAPCDPGEDPYHTRREDVLVPIQNYTDRSFAAVLPFYRLEKEEDTAKAVRLIRSQIMNLLEYDWSRLAAVMDETDARNAEPPEEASSASRTTAKNGNGP